MDDIENQEVAQSEDEEWALAQFFSLSLDSRISTFPGALTRHGCLAENHSSSRFQLLDDGTVFHRDVVAIPCDYGPICRSKPFGLGLVLEKNWNAMKRSNKG
jgi:hypothetical protein